MQNFLNKIRRSNKAMDVPIVGTLVILILFHGIVLYMDLFFSTVTRAEMQSSLELGQVYSLVKAVDLHASRDSYLHVNMGIAKRTFFQHFDAHNRVGERSLIRRIVTSKQDEDFIYIVGSNSDYMFGDNKARPFVSAKSRIEFIPYRIVKWNERPVVVHATSRIFLE